jgi:hypothetical protein
LTGSNRIPFHDQVNTRVQPECRPALSVRSAGAQAQSFHYTTHNVYSVVATTRWMTVINVSTYNKKKPTFEIDFFLLLF